MPEVSRTGGPNIVTNPESRLIEMTVPFLGEATKTGLERYPNDHYAREMQTYEDAFRGKRPYLEKILITTVAEQDKFWIRNLLPWQEQRNGVSFEWDVLEFTDHMLVDEPVLMVPRVLTSRMSTNRASMKRQGIGMIMEWDFANTDRGKLVWRMHILQIVNAVTISLCFNAALAILQAGLSTVKITEPTIDTREKVWKYVKRKWAEFGLVHSSREALGKRVEQSKAAFRGRNMPSGNYIVMPNQSLPFARNTASLASNVKEGPRGIDVTTSGAAAMAGITTFESSALPQGQGLPSIDPLQHAAQFSSFFCHSRQVVKNADSHFRTDHMDVKPYDSITDSMARVSYRKSLAFSGLWYTEETGGYDETGSDDADDTKRPFDPEIRRLHGMSYIGHKFFKKLRVSNWGEYMDKCGIMDDFTRHLTSAAAKLRSFRDTFSKGSAAAARYGPPPAAATLGDPADSKFVSGDITVGADLTANQVLLQGPAASVAGLPSYTESRLGHATYDIKDDAQVSSFLNGLTIGQPNGDYANLRVDIDRAIRACRRAEGKQRFSDDAIHAYLVAADSAITKLIPALPKGWTSQLKNDISELIISLLYTSKGRVIASVMTAADMKNIEIQGSGTVSAIRDVGRRMVQVATTAYRKAYDDVYKNVAAGVPVTAPKSTDALSLSPTPLMADMKEAKGTEVKFDLPADSSPDAGAEARRYLMRLLSVMPTTYDFPLWCVKNDVRPPINLVGGRQPEYLCGDIIHMTGDGFSGWTLHAKENFMLAVNTAQEFITGHFSMWSKSVVFQKLGIEIFQNAVLYESLGGDSISYWNPLDTDHVSSYRNTNDKSHDIFVMAVPANEDHTNTPMLDFTGNMHPLLSAWNGPQLSTADIYASIWGWQHDTAQVPYGPVPSGQTQRARNSTLAGREQYYCHGGMANIAVGSHNGDSLNQLIEGQGVFGTNVYSGVGLTRNMQRDYVAEVRRTE